MYMIEIIIRSISDFLWGWPLILLVALSSLVVSYVFRMIQIRYFWQAWTLVFKPSSQKTVDGDYITPLQAFLNTLSASLGNGSAAGMATAIASGGPGAAFWICIIGFFGIALRFVEVYASSYFIDENSRGSFRGGPMIYLGLVPGKKYLPAAYAFFCLLTSLVAGSAMQCNSMAIGINRLTQIDMPFIGVLLFLIVVYILYGGSERIMRFSDTIIPIKVGLFFISMIALLIYHGAYLGSALIIIMQHAFTWKAVAGAGMGYTMQTALRYGISRSVSATELGLGTSGVLFGATGGKNRFNNSIMSMASLMISNHLVCCALLLLFVASGVWDSGLTSTALTSAAFETLFGVYGKLFVTFLSISFGLGVLVAYAYIGRECWIFLMPRTSTTWYVSMYAAMAFLGVFGTVGVVWAAVDIVNAGMLIINIYGLLMLLPILKKAVVKDEQVLIEKSIHQAELPHVYKVAAHTDNVGKGSTFVAVVGTRENGAQFIPLALEKGASTIVISADAVLDDKTQKLLEHVASYRVENARKALSELSARAYNYPAKKLNIIGVTGTKGKTTVTYLLEHILKHAGYKTARLSTVGNAIGDHEYTTVLTTQQPDYIHMFLDRCVSQQVDWVVIEVAAQALSLHRVNDIAFDAVIFTNFSQEHSEFYPTQQDYFAAKASILKQLKHNAPVILNGDDVLVRSLTSLCINAHMSRIDDIDSLSSSVQGVQCYIDMHLFKNKQMLGAFNIQNIHMAYLTARSLGVSIEIIQQAVESFSGVPGRLDKYTLSCDITAYIDYAHTPSSMLSVLSALRGETDHLIVVFGAGGDRDAIKRPLMGSYAAQYADIVVITTDNPRSEDPEKIVEDIMSGIPEERKKDVYVEYNRELAIKYAYSCAKPGAIIALLGKGPDEYQLVNGEKYYFSEKEILKSL